MATLQDAITTAEQAMYAYQTAANKTTTDIDLVAQAQAKVDAMSTVVDEDKVSQLQLANDMNAALDALILAANEAKVTPPPTINQPPQIATPRY